MRGKPIVLVVPALVAALALPAGAGASVRVQKQQQAIGKALTAAVKDGRLTAEEAAAHRAVLARAVSVQGRLPGARAQNLAGVIGDLAAVAPKLDQTRALVLFEQLDLNTRHLGTKAVPPGGADVQGHDGTVYRAFAGRGLQFHPLANFAKLNSLLAARREPEAQQLAQSLLLRAVHGPDGTMTWEYLFPFGGGKAPWVSGMAQAVAAQALARAGYLPEASAAFRAVRQGLLLQLPAGPWVKLYDFTSLAVVNAQLQAVLSLGDYATLAEDPEARALADQLLATATALMPDFDTGAWTLYALRGAEANLHYHDYVASLARRVAQRTADPLWVEAAARITGYLKEPPRLGVPLQPVPAIYPWPADGWLDAARIPITLSKASTVTLRAAGQTRTYRLPRGRSFLTWTPGKLAPGTYPARLTAVDLAGNPTEAELPAVEVRRDSTAPELLAAGLSAGRLSWRAVDAETPWLRLTVRLEGAGATRVVDLGRRPLAGGFKPAFPKGAWRATLVVSDSSGNRVERPLGAVFRR